MRLFVITIALSFLLGSNIAYSDELNPEKKAAIKKLLEVTGATQIGELFAKSFTMQMTQVLKKSKPDIDPKAFEIVESEINTIIHEELVVNESFFPYMYPIYHKYLTLEETNGLIRFYETPLGKKAVSVMPKMTQEGMQAGQLWGQSIGQKIQDRLAERFKKEGIEM